VSLAVRLIEIGVGIARIDWEVPGPIDLDDDSLRRDLVRAAEAALGQGVRRLEVAVPAADRLVRRAVLRAGFRVEGVRRSVITTSDGGLDDLVLYARLADDVVGGPNGFSGVMNTVLPRKRLIAHVLFRDEQGRVLLCDTRFKIDWELPGGIVEAGEPPREAAVREVREELGIDLAVGRLLVVDWLPPYLGWEDAVEMIFHGGLVTETGLESFSLQANEIDSVALVTLAEAADLITPLAHRRLSVAVGQRHGETAYLEDGRRV
jgi:8-oxo-dGTP diphosphatase